ncbi:MAG: hypothetical protein E6Y12_07120 [Dermabacter sp.]|nr:hypothetical protein [Dermabacter sp.]
MHHHILTLTNPSTSYVEKTRRRLAKRYPSTLVFTRDGGDVHFYEYENDMRFTARKRGLK